MRDMRRCAISVVAVAAACAAVLQGASAAAATSPVGGARDEAASVTWGKAQEVPGTATLNKGGGAGITAMSCASVGNCSAGGYYTTASNISPVFVVSETNGTWHKAEEVPGTAALNNGGQAGIVSAWVSCASAGNCSAAGTYVTTDGEQGVFAVNETHGTWHKAEEVARPPKDETIEISSISCASAGNCSAAGDYTDASSHGHVFMLDEIKGTWHKPAVQVPSAGALGGEGNAWVNSVSCRSAGNCSAGGYYVTGHNGVYHEAFVVSEINGTWQKADEVPGTATLNKGGVAEITSVSCASAGHCSAGGSYEAGILIDVEAFVVNET
jgi:hypothetical protein